MASWQTFHDDAPALADEVRARFAANTHHVLGTLRTDGTPRLSGTEVFFWRGEIVAGSMPRARKALDLQRDPRCAVHANPSDPEMRGGDAKFDADAVEVLGADRRQFFTEWSRQYAAEHGDGGPDGGPAGEAEWDDDGSHLFRFDLRQVVLTRTDAEAGTLTVALWQPGEGVRHMTRT